MNLAGPLSRKCSSSAVTPLLNAARKELSAAGVVRADWNAQRLLSAQLEIAPIDLFIEPPDVSQAQKVRFEQAVAARASGMPLQYLLGTAEFYGREFEVGPGVFIPRPETEILVETALELLEHRSTRAPVVADVGTGSGAIALTLALERPEAVVIGLDRSREALEFAGRNRLRHAAPASKPQPEADPPSAEAMPVCFFQGDGLEQVGLNSVDLLVSNPPYLDPKTASDWPPELAWEPRMALEGGKAGLETVTAWMRAGQRVLHPGGVMLLEIGLGQAPEVQAFARETGWSGIRLVRDLAGIERVAVLRRRDRG